MWEDYSLIKLGNHFASEGDELMAHKFQSGSVRMVSRCDFERWRHAAELAGANESSSAVTPAKHFWQPVSRIARECLAYYGFLNPDAALIEPGPVVGIPSQALLRVFDIPAELQEKYHLGPAEDALLTEISPRSPTGDALCFGNGAIVPLQSLREGQRIKILRRSLEESLESEPEHAQGKTRPGMLFGS